MMLRRKFCVGALAAVTAVSGSAETLRILTFNVRYPAKSDGENRWEMRRDLLVATVREKAPDLIGAQELYYEQGQYIVEKLPGYAWFGVSRRGNHEDEHMGVFYRKDKLKLLESGDFWLSETPEQPGSMSWDVSLPRMVTWGLFATPAGRRFYFANTHFPHRGQDAGARVKCAELLIRRLKEAPPESPVILTGDFNTGAGSEPYKVLTAALTDAWEVAARRTGPTGTFNGFKGVTTGPRIDWILYRGPWKVLEAETVTKNDAGRYPSDHFPVFALFEWQ